MSRSRKHNRKLKEGHGKKPPYMSILFMVIVIAIFSAALFLIISKSASLEPVNKEAIKMTITMAGFEPNIIRAKQGQPVTINLINPDNSHHTDGGGVHNFVLTAGLANLNISVQPESQKDCYIKPDGSYEPHASECKICNDITLEARDLLITGYSLKDVREKIDDDYSGRGAGTNTSLPP